MCLFCFHRSNPIKVAGSLMMPWAVAIRYSDENAALYLGGVPA